MSGRCVGLIVSLRDSSQGLEGTKALEIADEVEASVSQPVIVFPNLISIEIASSFESIAKLRNGAHGAG